jgi:hypothetical protein
MIRTAILAICILLLAIQNPVRPADEKGTVQGTVTRLGSGDPIIGAQIRLSDPVALQKLIEAFARGGVNIAPPPNGLADAGFVQRILQIGSTNAQLRQALDEFQRTNDPSYVALTGADGRFTIRNVVPGNYTIAAARDGYFGGTANNTDNLAVTATLSVVAGRSVDVTLQMIQGATISGRVTLNGMPQVGVMVQGFVLSYENGYQILRQVVSRTTDDRGDYRLYYLSSGEYLVAATPRNGSSVRLVPDAAAAPPASPDQPMRTFYPGVTDGATAVLIPVKRSEEIAGIDIEIRTERTYRVSGEVYSDVPLTALAGQSQVFTARGATPNAPPTVSADVSYALHDPDVPDDQGGRTIGAITLQPSGSGFRGKFVVTGVPAGSYDWRSSVYEIPTQGTNQPTTTIIPIEVRNQDVSGLVFELHQTVPVKGVVTVDGHAPGPMPVKLFLQVEGASAKRPGYQAIASRVQAANAQDGSFTVPGVQNGRFRVMPAAGWPPDLYIESVRQGGQDVFDAGFVVDARVPDPLQVTLRTGAGTVEGTVQDSARRPISGVTVALVPLATYRQNRARYQSVTSDATGRFVIRSIIPGEYKLFAWPDVASGAYFNAKFLSRYEDRGKAVTVGQSGTATVDVVAIER